MRGIDGRQEDDAPRGIEGGANVTLEFDAGFDADIGPDRRARQGRPGQAGAARGCTDEPTVTRSISSLFPVLVVTLSGDVPERTLVRLARDLRDKIEAIPPCWSVRDRRRPRRAAWKILVDPMLVLESYGLNARDDHRVQVVNCPIGWWQPAPWTPASGRFSPSRCRACSRPLEDILSHAGQGARTTRWSTLPVISASIRAHLQGSGRLRPDKRTAVRWRWRSSKRTGENIIETIEAVRAVVEAERAAVAGGASRSRSFIQDKSNAHPHHAAGSAEQRRQRGPAGDDRGGRRPGPALRRTGRHCHSGLVPDRHSGAVDSWA